MVAFARAAVHQAPLSLDPGNAIWSDVVPAATRHGIRPLVYQVLSWQRVGPEWLLNDLRIACASIARRNLLLASELVRVVGLLEEASIPAFSYKGPVLAAAVYGDLGLREFIDLDVMVPQAETRQAREVLRRHGYSPESRWNRAQDDLLTQRNGEFDLYNAERQIPLDLHWAFSSAYFRLQREPRDLWARLQTVSLGGAAVKTLATVDLLIVLCLHGAKSCWGQLKWVCDVAQVSRRLSPEDWPNLWYRAVEWDASRSLLLGLKLAHDLVGTELPDGIGARVAVDSAVQSLAASVVEGLATPQVERPSRSQEARFYAALSSKIRDRLRVWTNLLTVPTTEDAGVVALSPRLRFIYYLLRPLRLALKHVWHQRRHPMEMGT
jgi:hypothetical protein